jgi:purine nucleosidase
MAGRYYICLNALLLAAMLAQTPVIIDHDGGATDDYVSTALVLTMPNVKVMGIIVSPGVTFPEPAVSVTRKLLDLMGIAIVPVARSDARGVNPFPTPWRRNIYIADALPILNQKAAVAAPLLSETGADFLIRAVNSSAEPVTLLVTGPLSTVAQALNRQPEIEKKIARIVWMGGALRVPGNVSKSDEPSHDGSAEWNVYFDAPAAARVWKTKIPLILCPLDATNKAPVTKEVLRELARLRSHPLADFAGQVTALAAGSSEQIYFWDALAAAWLGRPELFKLADWEVDIVTSGPSEGRTLARAGGRKVQAMDLTDVAAFYRYFLKQMER